MKRIIPILFLAVAAFAQVNVQKTSGTNAITGNLVIGEGKALTATGSGSITATALTTNATATNITGTGNLTLSGASSGASLVIGQGSDKIASLTGRLFLGTGTALASEHDALYVVTPTITDSIGRGVHVVTTFAGSYGATGVNSYLHTAGSTVPNHLHNFQSHFFHEGSYTLPIGAAYWGYLDNSAATGGWTHGYNFLSQGYSGTITNPWAFFARGSMPSYFGGKTLFAENEITGATLASTIYGRVSVAHPHGTISGGLSSPTVSLFSTTTAAVGVGGSLALGGESGAGTNPYPFAHLLGAKEQSGATYNGYLGIYTTDTGSNNSEKARVTSTGNLLVGTTSETGLTGSGNIRATGTVMAATIAGASTDAILIATSGTTRITVKGTGVINLASLPTSASGLSSGDLWSNSGVLTVVP